MTKGVAENFLVVLAKDRRAATRRSAWTVGALALLAFLTMGLVDRRLDGVWFGTGLAAFGVALFAGVAAGALRGRLRYHHGYEESLRFSWNRWMRYSVSAPTSHAIHRQVRGQPPQPSVWRAALGLAALLFVSFVLMVVTLLDPSAPLSAASLFALYALLGGATLGDALVFRAWAGRFRAEVTRLVRSGDLPVWGVV